jgi:1,4-dihydroxy-2-naphthoate octaprenyltransferase
MARQRTRDPDAIRGTLAVRLRRVRADGLFAAALALAAFLLSVWPFVRTPPLDTVAALELLFVVWAAFIAVLAAMMGGRVRARPRGSRR